MNKKIHEKWNFTKKWSYNNFQFSVIESYRDDGKVKHRTLVYLAAIDEHSLGRVSRLERFWEVCERKLSQFSDDDRLRLIARLESFVPRPSEEMREEAKRQYEETRAKFSQLRGFNPQQSRNPYL